MLADAKTGTVGVKELGGCQRRVKRKSQEKCSNKVCLCQWGCRMREGCGCIYSLAVLLLPP